MPQFSEEEMKSREKKPLGARTYAKKMEDEASKKLPFQRIMHYKIVNWRKWLCQLVGWNSI